MHKNPNVDISTMNETQHTLRRHIYTHFLTHCRPPTVAELSGAARVTDDNGEARPGGIGGAASHRIVRS